MVSEAYDRLAGGVEPVSAYSDSLVSGFVPVLGAPPDTPNPVSDLFLVGELDSSKLEQGTDSSCSCNE